MGFCVVIKCRRNPVLHVVAIAAMGFGVLDHELAVVRVLMAGLALLRCSLESRSVFRCGLMAIAANDRAVGT